MLPCFVTSAIRAIPINLVPIAKIDHWLYKQDRFIQNWVASFKPEKLTKGKTIIIPGIEGKISQVLCCLEDMNDYWQVSSLAENLPSGVYTFAADDVSDNFFYTWGLGAYNFDRYKNNTAQSSHEGPKLLVQENNHIYAIINELEAIYWVRDLINTPTDDLGPTELANEAVALAERYGATVTQLVGPELLAHDYRAIYTVGRASDDPPRLLELVWGNDTHPQLSLVGKGVCFDSGGLDLKSSIHMLGMKKDMAGAAHVLGLARMIMQAQLPVKLRVFLPLVENVISGNAYHPGDIITSKKGLTIEIGNTDAEGRLILADAISAAVAYQPKLLIDIATLTGAARVALGHDLAALFSNSAAAAQDLMAQSNVVHDPMWHMPLYRPYRELLNSNIADLNNVSSEPYGGAITAALFLQAFVPQDITWFHLDIMAWNSKARPGRPIGGEANSLRALFKYIKEYF